VAFCSFHVLCGTLEWLGETLEYEEDESEDDDDDDDDSRTNQLSNRTGTSNLITLVCLILLRRGMQTAFQNTY
jgi:hypothetical protein